MSEPVWNIPIDDGLLMVIGDPHASPEYDNDRFERLGELARTRGATHVHCTGDWTDFESLLSHGTPLSQEGKRYFADVAAGNDALERFDRGLGGARVRKSISLGNHDARPDRFVADNPQLETSMSWRDVRFEEHGWRTVPWNRVGILGPFVVSHHLTNQRGKAYGGKMLAKTNELVAGQSVIVGHDHRFQLWLEPTYRGRNHSFVAGCCIHPDMRNESWCAGQSHAWDIGVLWVQLKGGRVSGFVWDGWA